MIPHLREEFNARYTPERYQRMLSLANERCGVEVAYRQSETPVFLPKPLLDTMVRYGQELLQQATKDSYRAASEAAIPAAFRVPQETDHPLFVQADFGLIRDEAGYWQPRLVEIQGFPSLYAYQPLLAECYREAYDLGDLPTLLDGLTHSRYQALLRQAIVGSHDPEHVILMEVDPEQQKTLPDFRATEQVCGIRTVDIREIRQEGRRLFYEQDGQRVPVRRIYNRVIVDELQRRGIEPAFRWTDDLDVEWAGHPNWFFRLSKFTLPFFQHECVPQAQFLDKVDQLTDNLDSYVLKPLFSFAGQGVRVGPTRQEVEAVPQEQRGEWLLQERMEFVPCIATPEGMTKMEVRVMFIWLEEQPRAVTTIIRTGRGGMMGVDQNRNLQWVGASAAFWQ